MRSKALVALGRIVLAKRERVIALEAYDKGLIGTTLRYPYEVRNAKDYFAAIPERAPAPEMLRLAALILDGKLQAFDPTGFRDRYEEVLFDAYGEAGRHAAAAKTELGGTAPRRQSHGGAAAQSCDGQGRDAAGAGSPESVSPGLSSLTTHLPKAEPINNAVQRQHRSASAGLRWCGASVRRDPERKMT